MDSHMLSPENPNKMDEIELESIACDLCGGLEHTISFKARDYRFGHPETFSFVRCLFCGLTYLNPRPTSDSIIKLYEKDYTPEDDQIVVSASGTNRWKAFMVKIGREVVGSYTDDIVNRLSGKVLDIGCGNGYLLQSLKQKGCDVYGIEANPNSANRCRNSGLPVFHGMLEEARFPDNSFDAIILSQVLEHLPSPRKALKEIHRIVKPNGKVLIYIPNPDGYIAKAFGKYWHGWHIPFHFYALTEKTIRKLAEETDFSIDKIGTVTPMRYLTVSLKSCLWGAKAGDTRPIERGKFLDSPLFIISISPIFRILDTLSPGKGDCLMITMTKGGR